MKKVTIHDANILIDISKFYHKTNSMFFKQILFLELYC